MKKQTLGIDLGTNSLGWSVIEFDDNNEPQRLVTAGVRIFQEAVEARSRAPKNQARRVARAARRITKRRRMHRDFLLFILRRNDLIATDEILLQHWESLLDPYELRKRALDEKLIPEELGRIFLHICKRRGYKSNRITDEGVKKKKETGKVTEGISVLKQQIEESGARTLGEFLYSQKEKRRRHTEREMYENEFQLIWNAQKMHYPELLTDELQLKIYQAIFWQRPLRGQPSRKLRPDGKPTSRTYNIGRCTFEPNCNRAHKATLLSHQFRILQDLNNLRIIHPITHEERRLTHEERESLFETLQKQKTITWDKVRKNLGLMDSETFNFEHGKKEKLKGNITACSIRSALKAEWERLTADQQEQLVEDMLTISDEGGILKRLKGHYNFSDETAMNLAMVQLESGVMNLSRKAMRKILPYLQQGFDYSDACREAGYDHSNPATRKTGLRYLPHPPELRNPVVQKAIWETKRVINAIIRKYGKPQEIRIEMARDMKMSKKQKDEINKRNNALAKKHELIDEILRDTFGIQNPSRDDRLRYKLWEECNYVCPYTGEAISQGTLFNEVDIEHIIPYSMCLDDSFMNKTLCIARENREVKRNQTPYEAYHASAERYEQILQRVDKSEMPFPKKTKFRQKEIELDQFIERQLNDTRYICTAVKDYLQQLGIAVDVTKGMATAELRRLWNLNTILAPQGQGEKNRLDHRHHAIDAAVIALTTRSLFQQLSRISTVRASTGNYGISPSEWGFEIPEPWNNFRPEVAGIIANLIVSHAVNHKITGPFHEETAYGFAGDSDKKGYVEMVVRKPVSGFDKVKQLESVRDPEVRKLMEQRLQDCGGDFKKAFNNPDNPLMHKDGNTPIKSVRMLTTMRKEGLLAISKGQSGPYKYHPLGSNHHVEIIENVHSGKRKGIFVTTLEAANRARRQKSAMVQEDHGSEWRFIAALHINDMVEVENDGRRQIYRVQKMSDPEIALRLHTAATLDNNNEGLRKKANNLVFNPIKVDEIGLREQPDD